MCHGEYIMRRKKLQPWESVMKGIKPTSSLNNMIIYTNPPPAQRNGRLLGLPSQPRGRGRAWVPAARGRRLLAWLRRPSSSGAGHPHSLPPQLPGPRAPGATSGSLRPLAVRAHRPSPSVPSVGVPRTVFPGSRSWALALPVSSTACRGETGSRSGLQAAVGAGRG